MILKPTLREGVMPLPVTFISTISRDGVRNIAPWSCVMPILRVTDLICAASAHRRDTLDNIRETGQFVLNLPGIEFVDKIVPTAKQYPPEVDEFLMAGLEEKPSCVVRPPGIKGCYAWMECELVQQIVEEKYVLLIGRVVHLEVSEGAVNERGLFDITKTKPLMISGLGKDQKFSTLDDIDKFGLLSPMLHAGKESD